MLLDISVKPICGLFIYFVHLNEAVGAKIATLV